MNSEGAAMLPILSTDRLFLISNVGLTVNLTAGHWQCYYQCTNIGIIVQLEVQLSHQISSAGSSARPERKSRPMNLRGAELNRRDRYAGYFNSECADVVARGKEHRLPVAVAKAEVGCGRLYVNDDSQALTL